MNDAVKEIRNNWLIIVFIASLIVGWTTSNNRLTAVEAQVQEQKTALQSIQQIQIDINVMKTDIQYIKKQY